MPPPLLVDLSTIDLNKVVISKAEILKGNPQRYEFEQLDSIVHFDAEKQILVGVRDIRADEWWVRGHIPGRPLFPGVLMIEAAAQLAGLFSKNVFPDVEVRRIRRDRQGEVPRGRGPASQDVHPDQGRRGPPTSDHLRRAGRGRGPARLRGADHRRADVGYRMYAC